MSVSQIPTIQELVRAARTNLDQNTWDYLVGGAETETTLRRNRQAIDSLALRSRILRDVSAVRTEVELLGHRLRIPVFLPPIGSVQVFSAGGGAAVARAAEQFGTLQFLSSVCLPELEEVAAASKAPKVYQLYLLGDNGVDGGAHPARHRRRLHRVLPHRRHPGLQPARARPAQALHPGRRDARRPRSATSSGSRA